MKIISVFLTSAPNENLIGGATGLMELTSNRTQDRSQIHVLVHIFYACTCTVLTQIDLCSSEYSIGAKALVFVRTQH